MVLAVEEDSLTELQKLADIYETEMTVLGHSDGSGILKVWHGGQLVCELDCRRLHEAPRRHLDAVWQSPAASPQDYDQGDLAGDLKAVLGDFAIVSRAPVIREYDHEVQGNTVLKPLAGAAGDAPQDASVVAVDGSRQLLAMGLSILPEWGKTDPYAMGLGCIDETVRQLVACGANPDKIALLDNFCVGKPEDPKELGALVETCKGMADAALAFVAPFVSGKDSFYNYFETDEGAVSIPVTFLASGIGVVEDVAHVTGASLRGADSVLCLIGQPRDAIGGSVYARVKGLPGMAVPHADCAANLARYRLLHRAIKEGLVLSAHDISEGGLAVTAAEMGFSMKGGIEIDLPGGLPPVAALFAEAPGQILVEVAAADLPALESNFAGGGLRTVGRSTADHADLVIRHGGDSLIREPLAELKTLWKNGLTPYY